MNINTDYNVRQAIAAVANLVENVERHELPRRDEIETKLENLSEAIIQAAVDAVMKKFKPAGLQ